MTTATQKYIIRCDRAGVFYAEVAERNGDEAVLRNARRIHYWTGAASISQMAMNGIRAGSRLTVVVPEMTVLGVIEVIPCSDEAARCMEEFPVWKV